MIHMSNDNPTINEDPEGFCLDPLLSYVLLGTYVCLVIDKDIDRHMYEYTGKIRCGAISRIGREK